MTLRTDTRGQTLQDFAIGMAIFLLVLGYVFAFIPSLFQPFSPDTDSTAIRVDRTADFLTKDLLADEPGILNATCTAYFFNGSTPANCDRFTQAVDADRIRELAALTDRTSLNVTMTRGGSVARYEDEDEGTRLATGPNPDHGGGRVIRAVRIVSLDGRDYHFVVRIW